MATGHSSSTLLLVSEDHSFAQALAEQIEKVLALTCAVATNYPAELPASCAVVIADQPVAASVVPMLVLPPRPLRMPALLHEIITMLKWQSRDEIRIGEDYVLFPKRKELAHTPSGKTVMLTDKEIQLLQSLQEAGEEGRRKDELLKHIWGVEAQLETHTLETHIYRLRAKLKELGDAEGIIVAEDGGYILKVPTHAA